MNNLIEEFEKQVKLCHEIGRDKMIEIVNAQFPREHKWRFYANGTFCERCGVQLGSSLSLKNCE